MNDASAWVAVGCNLVAMALNLTSAWRYRRLLKELAYGHRQNRKDSGSVAGAISTRAPGERTGGTVPDTGASISPEPVDREIIGWRGWRFAIEQDGFGGWTVQLIGMHNHLWEGPTMTADVAPDTTNENGVYARPLDWYQRLLNTSYFSFPASVNPSPVQGSVALTGRVLEGERGWRAERATIRELWVVGNLPIPAIMVRQQLEDRYKCEVHFNTNVPFPGWYYI